MLRGSGQQSAFGVQLSVFGLTLVKKLNADRRKRKTLRVCEIIVGEEIVCGAVKERTESIFDHCDPSGRLIRFHWCNQRSCYAFPCRPAANLRRTRKTSLGMDDAEMPFKTGSSNVELNRRVILPAEMTDCCPDVPQKPLA